jgi:glycosyltransferase involved in cell wall biosynthesis
MGYAHGLELILDSARELRQTLPDVRFLLVGEGAEKEKLQTLAETEELDNVIFLREQPREQVPFYINASDVCLVLLRKADLFRTVLPSKMLEFMACARPVVLGVEGQARQILERAQAGLYVPPGDRPALITALMDLYRDPALRARLGESGREFVIKHYSREHKALQYLDIMNRLTAHAGTSPP